MKAHYRLRAASLHSQTGRAILRSISDRVFSPARQTSWPHDPITRCTAVPWTSVSPSPLLVLAVNERIPHRPCSQLVYPLSHLLVTQAPGHVRLIAVRHWPIAPRSPFLCHRRAFLRHCPLPRWHIVRGRQDHGPPIKG
jgi:hypothetical protein